jgi:lysophospholipase L1-like esterase
MKPLPQFKRAALVAAVLAAAVLGHAADPFFLKDGDRVVFYGDSITEQRLYTTFVETYVTTRFPNLKVTYTLSGWGGDRVTGGGGGKIDTRLERDVIAYKPTVMTIMLGMNDAGYRPFDQGLFDTYKNGLASIVDKVQTALPGIRITMIQPSPFDDVTRAPTIPGGYNSVLLRYADVVKELAGTTHQQTVDFNGPVVAMLEKAKATNLVLSGKIITDRIHPGPAGHLIMAEALLKSWNAPAIVTAVEIDAAGGKPRLVSSVSAQISGLSAAPGLTWTQLDTALPMPVDLTTPEMSLAVASSDFESALNLQVLRVTHLPDPFYELKIDEMRVGGFSREDLAQGVNLAMRTTPMSAQAGAVYKLVLQRGAIHQMRWRTIQVPYAAPRSEELKNAMPGILAAFDAEDAATAVAQREAARPVAHRYELTPQNKTAGVVDAVMPAQVGVNLALNKPYVSSAENAAGWNVGLTDGSYSPAVGKTFATNNAPEFPKMVTVDLESAVSIGVVVVATPPFGSTKTVAVSISADGRNFKEVGRTEFILRSAEKRVFKFAPAQARYVRLTYVDNYAEQVSFNSNYSFTSELEVYAPEL